MQDKYYVRIIDNNGFFVKDTFVESLTDANGEKIPTYIETPCPDGFYLPKWDGSAWVEGKTVEEIAAIQGNATTSAPTLEERTTALESTQSDVIDVLATALGVTI